MINIIIALSEFPTIIFRSFSALSAKPICTRKLERATMEKPQKKCPPNIVKSNNALKLAEQWVNNMSKAADDEPTEVEGRPSGFGLGAKIPRQTKIGPLKEPLERKLYAKLGGRTKNSVAEESTLAASKTDRHGDDSDDSEDLESRTQVFDKKRAPANPAATAVQTKKKKK